MYRISSLCSKYWASYGCFSAPCLLPKLPTFGAPHTWTGGLVQVWHHSCTHIGPAHQPLKWGKIATTTLKSYDNAISSPVFGSTDCPDEYEHSGHLNVKEEIMDKVNMMFLYFCKLCNVIKCSTWCNYDVIKYAICSTSCALKGFPTFSGKKFKQA